ncbi:hypothetical protein GCM10010911_28040 [Paenibacillus nasutitermitis]|uniref:Uncharacterized protein n=1 Tax=Paenibacillus nasutitermitis TaxID=1652958 RepID=A0A916YZ16_9BACL|nr:hypothetical protein GCM10010911_28040 [Paenibacillus nasutitermitis]
MSTGIIVGPEWDEKRGRHVVTNTLCGSANVIPFRVSRGQDALGVPLWGI